MVVARTDQAVFDQYVDALPTAQNAVDSMPGWASIFPSHFGLVAGSVPLFEDGRIVWLKEIFGDMMGRHVLELGPLEGGHTYMLDAAGAIVDAVEANKSAFMRCLISKEITGMVRARFHLGSFVAWLEEVERNYDLIVASGVLYHMKDPLHLLRLIAARTSALYVWTHYFSDAALPESDPRRKLFAAKPTVERFEGLEIRLYRRTYAGAQHSTGFCGGLFDEHHWIERDDLFRVLEQLGFDSISIEHDDIAHVNGPAFSLFARRTKTLRLSDGPGPRG